MEFMLLETFLMYIYASLILLAKVPRYKKVTIHTSVYFVILLCVCLSGLNYVLIKEQKVTLCDSNIVMTHDTDNGVTFMTWFMYFSK